MLEEKALEAYKNTHKWEEREGKDGRNSITRQKTLCDLCSNQSNDPQCNSYSKMYPDLHDDFMRRIPLFGTDEIALHLVTPSRIKDQLATLRYKASKKKNQLFLICI